MRFQLSPSRAAVRARTTMLILPALLAAGAAVGAQTLDQAVPAAGGPGDLVILRGTGLAGVGQVQFTASVGGFAGFLTKPVTPLSATDTELRVTVPQFNAFVGPQAVPPSGPLGFLTITGPFGGGPQLDFFFFEEPFFDLTTFGQGTTQSGGQGRPVTSFDIQLGPPKIIDPASPPFPAIPNLIGNPNFTARLENASPAVPAVLLIGAPGTPPFFLFGDGELVLDPAAPFLLLPAGTTDAQGGLSLGLPVRTSVQGTAVLQFLAFDPGLPHLAAASGLQVGL